MDGLAGGALYQIVDGADDDGAAGGSVELEADVAKIGPIDGGQVGQVARLIEAHEFLAGVVPEVDVEKLFGGLDIARAHIDCFEDAPIDGEQVRGECQLRFVETRDHEDFCNVAVIEGRIDGEIVGDLAEAGFERGLAAGAAHAGLRVAHDAGGSIGHAACDQRLNCKIRGGGITAGVRDQARGADALSAELGEPIDRFGQQIGRGVVPLVPARVGGGVAKAEGAAEVDDFGPGGQHGGCQLHGDFGRRSEEDYGQSFGADGIGRAWRPAGLRMVDGRRTVALILTMFQENGFGLGMGGEQPDQFGAAVAAEADDPCLIFIHHSE